MSLTTNLPAEAGQGAISALDLAYLLVENEPNLPESCRLFAQPAHCTVMITGGEMASVRLIRDRFGLSPSIAALIAQLAGLGPREVRNV